MAGEQELFQNYTLVGGEETYKNPLNQSHLAARRLENLIPSVRGDLEQKAPSFKWGGAADLVMSRLFPYIRVNADGTVSRFLFGVPGAFGTLSIASIKRWSGTSTTSTTPFSGTNLALADFTPAWVAANNLIYFSDGQRWFVTDGTTIKVAGMPHPVDAPTFATAAGTLNVTTNRFYWVAWADLSSSEFDVWGNRSPRSLGTGALVNQKVTVTRPAGPPPRATHWLLFASETDDDATFGAWLATIPIATTTFEDQSPFLDESGSAMVAIRSPIRNSIPIPGRWAKLHKGRIFVGGFNRLPVVIRNPDFEDNSGATLAGWSLPGLPAWVTTREASAADKFDQAAAAHVVTGAGSGAGTVVQEVIFQDITRLVRPGRTYNVFCARRRVSHTGGGKVRIRFQHNEAGVLQGGTTVTQTLIDSATATTWTDTGTPILTFTVPQRDLQTNKTVYFLVFLVEHTADTDRIEGWWDFVRVWEVTSPLQVGFSALEEVEGLQNGRGEESMPGSSPPPFDDDASDVTNLLYYPQTAGELRGAESFNDSLVVFSDINGVPIFGDSFDDFHFSEQVTLATGLWGPDAITKSRHGLFFVSSDKKVFQAPLNEAVSEISLPIRDGLNEMLYAPASETTLVVFDYGPRSWLVLTYAINPNPGERRRMRLYDLETGQWFKFTEFEGSIQQQNQSLAVYEPVKGQRVLLVGMENVTDPIRVVADPGNAYAAGSGNAPTTVFRQVLLDLNDPGNFKVWKDLELHTNAPVADVTVTFWLDPFDPDNPGTGTVLTSTSTPAIAAVETLPELLRTFFGAATDAFGKRLLLQVELAANATAKKILGLEVAAERTVRHAR